jgi:hypothetical protein
LSGGLGAVMLIGGALDDDNSAIYGESSVSGGARRGSAC